MSGGGPGRNVPPVAVEVSPVETGPVRELGVFSGSLQPRSRFVLSTKVAGRLVRVNADVGDRVAKGNVVAVLDDKEYSAQHEQARADFEVVEATLEDAGGSLETARKELERARTLFEGRIASRTELDAAETAMRKAETQYRVVFAQRRQKQAALETVKDRLDATRLVAEWEGGGETRVVGERFVDPGTLLRANDPVVSILDIGTLTATVNVTEGVYAKMRPGLPAGAVTEAMPGRVFGGRVERVAPFLNETSRQGEVIVEIPNPDGLLKPGMFVGSPWSSAEGRGRHRSRSGAGQAGGQGRGFPPCRGRKVRRFRTGQNRHSRFRPGRDSGARPVRIGGHPGAPPPAGRFARVSARHLRKGRQPMKISRITVHRPVLTLMVTLIVVILGATAFLRLPVDLMPDISYPMLSISTRYANTGPEIIEQLITRPIEQALSAVPGVEDITSTIPEGASNVRLAFSWGTDLDAGDQRVRDRLDRVINRLPDEAERPRIFKFDYSAFPILFLGVYGSMDPLYLRRIIDDQISYRIERVPGVAAVEVWGGDQREIQVNVYPEALKALNLPIDSVVSRIQAGNVESPAGTSYRDNMQVSVRTSGGYANMDDIRNVVVAQRDGAPVRISQIADVDDTVQRNTRLARIDGRPGIRLAVTKQSGKNTVEVAEGVLEEIDRINEDIPQLRLVVLSDTSEYIKYSISNVGTSALYGGLIALVVLIVFLRKPFQFHRHRRDDPHFDDRHLRPDVLQQVHAEPDEPGRAGPRRGMLVDNSIVVLENIYRLRESGKSSLDASVEGSEEVASAVVASTLTTVVVFLPLIFIEGMSGVMYKQLALIVTFFASLLPRGGPHAGADPVRPAASPHLRGIPRGPRLSGAGISRVRQVSVGHRRFLPRCAGLHAEASRQGPSRRRRGAAGEPSAPAVHRFRADARFRPGTGPGVRRP
jgi:RND family efflux transporter MFP subunit